ncbi:MAG: septum formation protein Maf [Abditibacteriota bacterium]|nr:septum formation protein Maf [Abditibacteriota bacterium]
MKYCLCSTSPRRRELLKLIIPDFEIRPSGREQPIPEGTPPEDSSVMLALQKLPPAAEAGYVFICADTIVSLDGVQLGKPSSPEQAAEMLAMLSGRSHKVTTGFAAACGDLVLKGCENTTVFFGDMTPEDIADYVATGEPMDKAGAYGIQGLASRFIRGIEGDYFNVVGLPLYRLYRVLKTHDLLG